MPVWRLAGVAVLVLVAVGLVHAVDVADHLRRAQGWMHSLGAWGPIAFVAIYAATTLLAGPGLPFTLVAPALFGPWAGFVIMVVASSLSAAGGFLIARYLARAAVARRLEGNERFARVNRLLDEHAWIIIPFVRVVPVPFALNNYGFGLTSISFLRYLLLSELAMVPMNAVLVFGAGSALGLVSGLTMALGGVAAVIVVAVALAGHRTWRRGAAPRRER
jgi:uncharacterized membrane protein YdjX (TVP38/TMEM64 family)